MMHVDDGLTLRLGHNSNHDSVSFQLLRLKRGDKPLAHEAAHQAIAYRGGILRDVAGMTHMLKAIVAVDGF